MNYILKSGNSIFLKSAQVVHSFDICLNASQNKYPCIYIYMENMFAKVCD